MNHLLNGKEKLHLQFFQKFRKTQKALDYFYLICEKFLFCYTQSYQIERVGLHEISLLINGLSYFLSRYVLIVRNKDRSTAVPPVEIFSGQVCEGNLVNLRFRLDSF